MKVPQRWTNRITVINGKVYWIYRAMWYNYSLDVYRLSEDGIAQTRNLYQACYWGDVVAFPRLPFYSGGKELAVLENWTTLKKPKNWAGSILTQKETEAVCAIHPNFRYVLKKYKIERKSQLINVLIMWKKHPELELVLACGYYNVGMSERFWTLTEKKRREICRFMRSYPKYKNFRIMDILKCLKYGKPELYAEYLFYVEKYERNNFRPEVSISFDDYTYLTKVKGIEKDCFPTVIERKISIFKDILEMLVRSEHDIYSEYWRHPKDLIAIHARLVEEAENRKKAEELERIKRTAKLLEGVKKRFSEYARTENGYSIFVSTDYEEWKKQAKVLHQCIVSAGYFQGMAEGNYTVVFIQKDGEPQATAQVMPDGKIHQFYADELDRNNCLPSDEIREAFNRWLESVPKKKFRKYKRKAA